MRKKEANEGDGLLRKTLEQNTQSPVVSKLNILKRHTKGKRNQIRKTFEYNLWYKYKP